MSLLSLKCKIYHQKLKAVIALETVEQLVGKGYDQVQYPNGYVVSKFNTFLGTENPHQHLAQFKAAYGNNGQNDALLQRQFVSSFIIHNL